MTDTIYHRLREILDSHPNGFPITSTGVEIKLLKKIFTPEEAEMATQMTFTAEMPEQIAARIGRDLNTVTTLLKKMVENGQLFLFKMGEMRAYSLMPWAVGVFEFQMGRMDEEFANLAHEFWNSEEARNLFSLKTAVMRTIPIEKTIKKDAVVAPSDSIRNMIDNAMSFAVGDCICRKEAILNGSGTCDKPMEVCLRFAPLENILEDILKELSPQNNFIGRIINRAEAHKILDEAEAAGLVHTVENYKDGIINVCNCCRCHCIPLQAIQKWGGYGASAKSQYLAEINSESCAGCFTCEDRCPVHAIAVEGDTAVIENSRCIGCGLCATTCPSESISLKARESIDRTYIPENMEDRAAQRGSERGMLEKYQQLKI